MSANDILDTLKTQAFEPFRMVLTDGTSYEVKHPDLVWLGKRSLMVGFVADPHSTLYERAVKVDLLHISRLEPLEMSKSNGQS